MADIRQRKNEKEDIRQPVRIYPACCLLGITRE